MYKRNITLALSICLSTLSFAQQVTLRNGQQADQKRIDEVWESEQKLIKENMHDYYWLWRTANICKKNDANPCVLRNLDAATNYLRKIEPAYIQKLEKLNITKDGALDQQTQDIIISCYYGTGDPKLVSAQYPVRSFTEKILYPVKYVTQKILYNVLG